MSEARAKAIANGLRQELKELAEKHPRLSAKRLVKDDELLLELGRRAVEANDRFEWQTEGRTYE